MSAHDFSRWMMADAECVIRSARTSRHLAAHVRSERSPLHDVRQPAPARSSIAEKQIQMHGRAFEVERAPSPNWLAKPKLRRSEGWWSQTESNRRPPACKAGALPTELWPLRAKRAETSLPSRSSRTNGPPSPFGVTAFPCLRERRLVGLGRFELPTSRLSSARSNQLSYKPSPGFRSQSSVVRK